MTATTRPPIDIHSDFYKQFFANLKLFQCGLVSGIAQAVVFNPWDRALYLSVKDERVFLHAENFRRPMEGVMQTITQRTISAGLYFPLEDMFTQLMLNNLERTDGRRPWVTFFAGNIAGAINGFLLNPIASVKYHYWGKTECGKENFVTTAADMYRRGGFRTFMVGASATVQRDLIFGGVFALFRHELLVDHSINNNSNRNTNNSSGRGNAQASDRLSNDVFVINLLSASAATIISSPINYVRNIHYATPPEVAPESAYQILSGLLKNAADQPTLWGKISYIQQRYRIGWGTARVGFGMAFGSKVYNFCSNSLFPPGTER